MSDSLYELTVTPRERHILIAGLGALKTLAERLNIPMNAAQAQEHRDLVQLVFDAEEITEEELAQLDLDLVELNQLEREALTASLGLLAVGLMTGKVKDDIGVTPGVIIALGRKLGAVA